MGGRRASYKFEELKRKYPGVKLAEFLITQYCKDGNFYSVGEKYGVSHVCIRTSILRHKQEIIYEKPYIWSMYEYTLAWNKRNTHAASKKSKVKLGIESAEKIKETYPIAIDIRKSFTENVLNGFPLEMEYTKLLGKLSLYNTDKFTGNDIIEMAAKKGIKLYELDYETGSKKYIKV